MEQKGVKNQLQRLTIDPKEKSEELFYLSKLPELNQDQHQDYRHYQLETVAMLPALIQVHQRLVLQS